jgi:hypothetical protein
VTLARYGRDAFSVELMQMTPPGGFNASNGSMVRDWAQLVKRGDVLRVAAWYDAPENGFVRAVYEAAANL